VSLWFRNELRVVLCPDQLILLKVRASLTLSGWRREILDKLIVPCPKHESGDESWAAALATLDVALPKYFDAKAQTTVVLSNHFVRYALIPWSDHLTNEQEELYFAEHTFREMYGNEADNWEIRISQNHAGKSQVASAVDKKLLAGLRELTDRHGIALSSVQPLLMLAYNQSRAQLNNSNAWLVVVEQNYLCLMLLRNGQWSWVRTLRSGENWVQDLPDLLEREAFLADSDVSTVYISAVQQEKLPVGTHWNMQFLHVFSQSGRHQENGLHYALYVNG